MPTPASIGPSARPIRPFLKVLGYRPADGDVRSFLECVGCEPCTNCNGWYRGSEMAEDNGDPWGRDVSGLCRWCAWNLISPWEAAERAVAHDERAAA